MIGSYVSNPPIELERKALLFDMIHLSAEPLMVFDSNQQLIYANSAAEELFGYGPQDMSRKLFSEFTYESLEQTIRPLDQVFSSQVTSDKVRFNEVMLKRKNGTGFCAKLTFTRSISSLGINWIATITDMSHQASLAADLREVSEKLSKVNSMMERFLYSSSHDLRAPLTSILGLVNLVRIESVDQVVLSHITRIEETTLKLDKILKDIIDFSKTTYQRVRSKRIDFNALIWKVIRSARQGPGINNIKFDVTIDDRGFFFSDPERLEIIFENLIRNSITFSDRLKSFSFLRVYVSTNEKEGIFQFSDNGIGIGSSHLQNIFNIFYKASDLSRGAGLGLYIVKEGVNQLNGNLFVDSEIGFGTSIKVVIPNNAKGKLISRKISLSKK